MYCNATLFTETSSWATVPEKIVKWCKKRSRTPRFYPVNSKKLNFRTKRQVKTSFLANQRFRRRHVFKCIWNFSTITTVARKLLNVIIPWPETYATCRRHNGTKIKKPGLISTIGSSVPHEPRHTVSQAVGAEGKVAIKPRTHKAERYLCSSSWRSARCTEKTRTFLRGTRASAGFSPSSSPSPPAPL